MSRPLLSVAIIAQDEEANLRQTLPSLMALAPEIVLVDSGSTDGTVAVAKTFGARILHQNWLGFGAQKNFAIAQCKGEWILSLDADEVLSPRLADSINRTIATAAPQLVGFTIARRNLFLGRWLRHGGYYPDRKLRLFRQGRARFQNRAVHESMIADGPVAPLTGDLIHHTYPALSLYIEHMNRYSSAAVPATGKIQSLPAFLKGVVVNPAATFTYNYLLRGGFLDGREGLLQHLYHAGYVSWKYAKTWEQVKNQKAYRKDKPLMNRVSDYPSE